MKTDKQRLADFKVEQKALKKEMSSAKKDISKAKSLIRKKTKLIAKAEREIGHWYYQEQKRSTAEGRRKLEHFCTAISAAEQEMQKSEERKELCTLRVKQIKEEIKAKKQALKVPEVSEVALDPAE